MDPVTKPTAEQGSVWLGRLRLNLLAPLAATAGSVSTSGGGPVDRRTASGTWTATAPGC
jgi:hypothetical protein